MYTVKVTMCNNFIVLNRLVWFRPSQPIVHGDIWNEKMSSNPFSGKAELEHKNSFVSPRVIYLFIYVTHFVQAL